MTCFVLLLQDWTIRLVVTFLATPVANNFGKLGLDFLVLDILYRIDISEKFHIFMGILLHLLIKKTCDDIWKCEFFGGMLCSITRYVEYKSGSPTVSVRMMSTSITITPAASRWYAIFLTLVINAFITWSSHFFI